MAEHDVGEGSLCQIKATTNGFSVDTGDGSKMKLMWIHDLCDLQKVVALGPEETFQRRYLNVTKTRCIITCMCEHTTTAWTLNLSRADGIEAIMESITLWSLSD